MPQDVIQSLREVLQTRGSATEAEAAAYVSAMERSKRLVVEAWS